MKNQSLILSWAVLLLLLLIPLITGWSQTCPNRALDFDGIDDRIIVNPGPLTGNANFTFEAWFTSTATDGGGGCLFNFKRLFSLSGPTGTRFEFGECGGILNIFYANSTNSLGPAIVSNQNIRDGQWHCTAVVRNGSNVTVYLDGAQVWTGMITGALNFSQFRLGTWGGAPPVNELWQGAIDEVRLWSFPLTAMQISNAKNCLLQGNEPGLALYYKMDQGMAGMDNTSITSVVDATANGNDAPFSGFTLNGATSNFICSGSDLVYPDYTELELAIRDLPTQSIDLQEICSGDPAHFCLSLPDGTTPTLVGGATLEWQFRDGAGPWTPVSDPDFFGLCFPLLPGELTIDCSANTDGFVERDYRAKITVMDPALMVTCDYYSSVYELKICCPISPGTVDIMPPDPLCEEESTTIAVSFTSPDPFVMTPGPDVTIEWCINGDPFTPPDLFNFNHTFTPVVMVPTEFIFSVKVTNCAGKMETFYSVPINVDPRPICGSIIGLDTPPNLTLIATTPHLTYEICPGDDAAIGVDPMDMFYDCNKQWQYSFDQVTWINLGYSNTVQNTNILPTGSWPGTSIFYRIECQPLSDPSGCDPCLSDPIEIVLIEPPMVDMIVGDDQICDGEFSTLSVASPMSGLTYTWYCNGLEVGTGPTYMASQQGNYWVEISNGCQVVESAWFFLEVCKIIPVINCPVTTIDSNICIPLGQEIILSACLSESNCGPLEFQWTWIDSGGMVQTSTDCEIMDTPPMEGTTYQLILTEPISGCSVSTQTTVIPCFSF